MDGTINFEKVKQFTRKALLINEVENNLDFLYRFTDPDGIKTGKSGYSFGLVQFDVLNNSTAIACLKDCGFSPAEIERVKSQTTDIKDLNTKLKAHAAVVDKYDNAQIVECVTHVTAVSAKRGFVFADEEAFVHAADYHNQFYMNENGKMAGFLASLKRPVTAEDIRDFKLSLPWGQKRPDDVKRRYNNIVKLMRA